MGELVQFPASLGARAELDSIRQMRERLAEQFAIPSDPARWMAERWPAATWSDTELTALERVWAFHPPEYVMLVMERVVSSDRAFPPTASEINAMLYAVDKPRGRLMSNGVRWQPEAGAAEDPPGTVVWRRVEVPPVRTEWSD